MKKFVLNIFISLLSITLVFSAIVGIFAFLVPPVYSSSYNASIVDKMDRLKSLESPKIILVGNSNLAFGINSKLLQEKTRMNVVNLGMHGGLGNGFHERMATQKICEGDIVVISHTDYASHKASQPDLLWLTVENHFNLISLIGNENLIPALKALPDYIRTATFLRLTGASSNADDIYSSCYFNEYGDYDLPRPKTAYKFSEGSISVPKIADEDIKEINKLNDFCKKAGAHLVIAGYPIADGEFTPPKDSFRTAWNELENKVNCTVISDIDNYFFDYSYFYDTVYHLTTQGATLRTERLIEDLNEYINELYN